MEDGEINSDRSSGNEMSAWSEGTRRWGLHQNGMNEKRGGSAIWLKTENSMFMPAIRL